MTSGTLALRSLHAKVTLQECQEYRLIWSGCNTSGWRTETAFRSCLKSKSVMDPVMRVCLSTMNSAVLDRSSGECLQILQFPPESACGVTSQTAGHGVGCGAPHVRGRHRYLVCAVKRLRYGVCAHRFGLREEVWPIAC